MQGMWHMREKENAYWHLAGKPKGKELLGRHGYRWEVNINVDVKVIE
jgi:hypothetical protein